MPLVDFQSTEWWCLIFLSSIIGALGERVTHSVMLGENLSSQVLFIILSLISSALCIHSLLCPYNDSVSNAFSPSSLGGRQTNSEDN